MRRTKYLLILLLTVSQFISAAVLQPIETFSIEHGLSNSEITSLLLDKRGFLWIGTTDGLNCYDGYSFQSFHANPSDSSSIYNDFIIKLEEDNGGGIWCATRTGLSKYEREPNHFIYFPYVSDTSKRYAVSTILDIAIDNSGYKIYILGNDFLDRVDIKTNKTQRLFSREYFEKNKILGLKSIISLDHLSKLALISSTEVYLLDPLSDSISTLPGFPKAKFNENGGICGVFDLSDKYFLIFSKKEIWKANLLNGIIGPLNINNDILKDKLQIIGILKSTNNCIKIASSEGVINYDLNSDKMLEFDEINFQSKERLDINSFLEDNSGLYWFGTNDGLIKINPFQKAFSAIYLRNIVHLNEDDFITAVCFDKSGMIWTGLNSGKIIVINPYEHESKQMVVTELDLKFKINNIEIIFQDALYISTQKGLFIIRGDQLIGTGLKHLKPKILMPDQEVFTTTQGTNDSVWIAGEHGIYLCEMQHGSIIRNAVLSDAIKGLTILDIKSSQSYLWIAESSRIIQYDLKKATIEIISFPRANLNVSPAINSILPINEKELLIGTSDGLYICFADLNIINSYAPTALASSNFIRAINKDKSGNIWVSTNSSLISHNPEKYQTVQYDAKDGPNMSNYSSRLTSYSGHGEMLFASKQAILHFNPDYLRLNYSVPKVQFISASLAVGNEVTRRNLSSNDTLIIDHRYSYIRFNFSSLDFWAPLKNKYKYSLEATNKPEQWASLENQNYLIISGLKAGYYKLALKGSNNMDIWNENNPVIIIHSKARFMESRWAMLMYGLLAFLVFYFTFLYATKQLRKLNREYRERELIAKKVEQQKEELSIKNKDITDSINYAKRIQEALMPSQRIFKKFFPESFILHMPKDIVSGDFYWINEVDGRIYFAAVDCTGHGVPGAFMSIIGFELFRRITETEKKKQPAEILKSLSRGFKTFFRDIETYTLRDGMDVAFCAIDLEMKYLEFAGAFNPFYLIRDNSITEIKGDRFSVGLFNLEEENGNNFKNHVLPLYDGDIIYIFTDGFADQFGGPEGKKYKYRRFRHLLLALHQLPMEQQYEFLRRSISDWKGNLEQVDDILIMGIRIMQNGYLSSN